MVSITSDGVAKFSGKQVRTDLTGGRCDANLLMNGEIVVNGGPSGDVYAFGMRGGHDVATYRAAVRKNEDEGH